MGWCWGPSSWSPFLLHLSSCSERAALLSSHREKKKRVESTAVVIALSTPPDLWKWIFISIMVSHNELISIPITKTILVPDKSHYFHLYSELIDSQCLFSQEQKKHSSLPSRSFLHSQPCSFSTMPWSLLSFLIQLGANEDIVPPPQVRASFLHSPEGLIEGDMEKWHFFCTDTRVLQVLPVPAQSIQEEQKSPWFVGEHQLAHSRCTDTCYSLPRKSSRPHMGGGNWRQVRDVAPRQPTSQIVISLGRRQEKERILLLDVCV